MDTAWYVVEIVKTLLLCKLLDRILGYSFFKYILKATYDSGVKASMLTAVLWLNFLVVYQFDKFHVIT